MRKEDDLTNAEPLVTIWCGVYNFVDYLRDAFEGFLSQKTDFPFRIVVFDDASTDGSSDIVREYVEKYPDLFIGYIAKENTYTNIKKRNRIINELYEEYNKGKYIAECEGDDYWIDPGKLQKQVEYLETHPECSMVVHPAYWLDEETGIKEAFPKINESRYLTEWEVITESGRRMQTASFLYRSRDHAIDSDLKLDSIGEYHRRLYQFAKGKIYSINEPMSVYRFRHKGSWTEKFYSDPDCMLETQLHQQAFLERYDEYTGYIYHASVQMMINDHIHDARLMDPSLPIEEYEEIIDNSRIISDRNKTKYYSDRKRIGNIVRGSYTFDAKERIILSNCEYLVIFGCGRSSEYMKNTIISNGFQITGYLISDGEQEKEMEYPVWQLSKYPNGFEKTAVVIGLGQIFEKETRDILEEYGVRNIIDTFWLKEKDN